MTASIQLRLLIVSTVSLPLLYPLLLHYSFLHAQPELLIKQASKNNILFICFIQYEKIPFFMHLHPSNWFLDINRIGKLVFVIGGDVHIDQNRDTNILVINTARDDEYPPISKELYLYEALVASNLVTQYQFFFKFDSDTLVHISRLENLIALQNWSASVPLYAGSPLHHCLCSLPYHKDCQPSSGIHYCSGAAVLMSQQTILLLTKQKELCYNPPSNSWNSSCRSSDSWLGWCMNNLVGIGCTSAKLPGMPLPPQGKSFGHVNKKGQKTIHRHHFCQDLSSHGGVKHRQVIPQTWHFTHADYQYCITFHALKLCEDFRYIWTLIGNASWPMSLSQYRPCMLGVGVQIDSIANVLMPTITSWVKLAQVMGVEVFPFSGPFQWSYLSSIQHTCNYYAILQGSVYLRLLPLLHYLHTSDFHFNPKPLWLFSHNNQSETNLSHKNSMEEDCILIHVTSTDEMLQIFHADIDGTLDQQLPIKCSKKAYFPYPHEITWKRG